ncbi:exodeoxyribonuclease III [Propylenella binzhouense]|uniref:Exodeoxyribonuclease III n=1 Tax=Propylenella binzhouense TaxID=2555902 RepID=A0A964T3G2_9HYPH|nr:exodeoxyribonuclease III [Propylenella binzhouense]MYZ46842.1 exodeoxyribonuclease III [Propylenella binzhouense]
MPLTIATWNINSVRLRIDLVRRFLQERRPDVICLQETKCVDGSFPLAAFNEAGYRHAAIHGQKGYHGVAILSRLPLVETDRRLFCGRDDARHVSAVVDYSGRAITIHNFYVPAGGDEPDPEINWKFAHKLSFVDEMLALNPELARERAIIVGDLNIAPLEADVWSHKQLLRVVSHTPVETEGLIRVQQDGKWVDVMRQFVPPDEKLFTWWSYRSPDWTKNDRGRRLDHVWATADLALDAVGMEVLKEARSWERPSDHVPVLATFE